MDLIWINLNHRFKAYVGESSLDLAQIHQIRSPPGLKKKLKIIGQKFVISSRHTLIKPNDKILVCFHKFFICFKFMQCPFICFMFMVSIYLFYVYGVHLFVLCLWCPFICVMFMVSIYSCYVYGVHLFVLCLWCPFICFMFMQSIYLFYVHVVHLFVRSLGFIQGVLQQFLIKLKWLFRP